MRMRWGVDWFVRMVGGALHEVVDVAVASVDVCTGTDEASTVVDVASTGTDELPSDTCAALLLGSTTATVLLLLLLTLAPPSPSFSAGGTSLGSPLFSVVSSPHLAATPPSVPP